MSGAWCNQPGRESDLLIAAVILGALAAVVVFLVRRHQLRNWDLRVSPVMPSTTAILWAVALCAVILAVMLSLAVYYADPCAPEQKVANVAFLWAGVLLGVLLCLGGLLGATKLHLGSGRR